MSKRKKRVHVDPLCDYCHKPAELIPDALVYQKDYGSMVWICKPCGAWVGVHRGTKIPLGRLANAELRKAKIEAHAAFDRFWQAAIKLRGWTKGKARAKAYAWLSKSLEIPAENCHIGMFDIADCKRVTALCTAIKAVEDVRSPHRWKDSEVA